MKYLIYICIIFIVGCKSFKTQQTTVGSLPVVSSTDGVDTSMGCVVEPTPLSEDIKSEKPEVVVTKNSVIITPEVQSAASPIPQPIATKIRTASTVFMGVVIVLGVLATIVYSYRSMDSDVKK